MNIWAYTTIAQNEQKETIKRL